MEKKAFFYQGDTLLLPDYISDSQIDRHLEAAKLPLEMTEQFDFWDFFLLPPAPKLLLEETDSIETAAVSILPGKTLPINLRGIPIRQILAMHSGGLVDGRGELGRMLRACHIAGWRLNSVFCGRCGAKNIDAPIKEPEAVLSIPESPARLCPKCGRTEFPRISPAVIVIITDDENRILLAHNKRFKAGVYSHISGFNEPGETLETTVMREIFEEVNIIVKDINYIKSQPWPFPDSLMLAFSASYLSGTIKPDGIEILDAQWFTKDKLPALPGQGSMSRFLIDRWLDSLYV
jgi:NAD+ diphosphatase